MAIASFSPASLLGSVHGLLGWITSTTGKHHSGHASPYLGAQVSTTLRPAPTRNMACGNYVDSPPMHGSFSHSPGLPKRPLRVLRVMEPSPHNPTNAGRIRISGRMADVCAELDRLAALEANPRNNTLLQ